MIVQPVTVTTLWQMSLFCDLCGITLYSLSKSKIEIKNKIKKNKKENKITIFNFDTDYWKLKT